MSAAASGDTPRIVAAGANTSQLVTRAARVLARNFGWRHPDRTEASPRGLDLEIPPGQKVLVVGPSGVGKSTLLYALAGVLEQDAPDSAPDSGEPEAPGHDRTESVRDREGTHGQLGELLIDGVPAAERASVSGLLQQDPESSIVLARVGDDVAFGPENLGVDVDEIWRRVDHALEAVELPVTHDRATDELSGGQQQRLGLAGIMAMRPRLLLLDEPTANLDPEGVRTVREAVATVAAETGCTLIVVEHRTEVWSDLVDRVVVLDRQGVSHDGTPSEIFGDPELGQQLHADGVWVPGRRVPDPVVFPDVGGQPLLIARDLEVSREQPSSRALARRRRRVRSGRPVPEGAVAGSPAARPVNLEIRAGSATAITGVNGAGKSTLALTLAGLLVASAGSVQATTALAGTAPTDPSVWSGPELLTRAGTVFQEPEHQFLTSSVRAELGEGPRRAGWSDERIDATVQRLLDRLELRDVAEANPFTLSGGQKRRLSVGTVMAAAPDVLVLDEPTFGQDARTWWSVVDLLAEQIQAGCAVVVVTHDRELIAALNAHEFQVHPVAELTDGSAGVEGPGGAQRASEHRGPAGDRREREAPVITQRGWLARRDALTKLVCALALTVSLVLSADPVTSGIILAGELVALSLAGQRPLRLLSVAWPVLVAALFSGWATVMLAEDSGATLLSLGPLVVSEGSVAAGAAIALRGLALALPGLALLLSTDPTDLADGLARTARLPARFVIAALVGLRLLTVMLRQWQVLVTARRARGAGAVTDPRAMLKELAGRAFGLLVQALRRATRLAVTMEVRGFGGVVAAGDRTWSRPIRRTRGDLLLLGLSLVLALGAPWVAHVLGVHRFIWS